MKYKLYSKYSENINPNQVWNDYPRPQMRRDSYLNLNGYWDYAINKTKELHYQGQILVPFPVESLLSGVTQRIEPDDYLIYRRFFQIPEDFNKGRILLHFGAVDQKAEVILNNNKIFVHEGGYFPFSIDITSYLENNNELVVIVSDPSNTSYHAFGKQSLKPKAIWYTPITGIWQSTWLESVPNNYIEKIEITPNFDEKQVHFKLDYPHKSYGLIKIYYQNDLLHQEEFFDNHFTIKLKNIFPWTPDTPNLYDFSIQLDEDNIEGYFALRKFSIGDGPYGKCLHLNNQPYFINGVLDQGYYSDGLYTPASEEAYIDDIIAMKNLGYNTLRKHIKIEPLRFYYHCDRLGMIVWQDFINGGRYCFWKMTLLPTIGFQKIKDYRNLKSFGRKNSQSQKTFEEELEKTVSLLYNVPSLGLWTIFNEGWGQFRSAYYYEYLKKLDNTRIIDCTSGWFDQGAPDLASKHIYFRKIKLKKDKRDRPLVLSEFGGYSCKIKNHSYSDKEFGYRKFSRLEDFENAYIELYKNEVIPYLKEGLSAAIYTQLSDVEDEVNGLVTYDRKVCKLNPERVRPIHQQLTIKKES
jgi:beta-galactosidase/beta-glucuronidase